MLRLSTETSEAWVEQALSQVTELLLDHAHCEKKAASTAINMIFRYPERAALLRPLSALAREELSHFELVLSHLEARGVSYERQKPSAYAGKLMTEVRKDEPYKLLDTLLCCALIEGRSCERMSKLAAAFERTDEALAKLYRGLLASEARHHSTYVDLALIYFEEEEVWPRLKQLSEHEGSILSEPSSELRMHS
jgi:tRNA-(ms[2]io[6]A)-hydroxylase